ncbi:MAG: ROK family protein [Thiomicrospira sp.]|uniref:ROK family protein n=1 Tax=Thiomicrospira sp. TaxID=935 RepID=UPI0019F02B7B|nr:ROK family protein [Thiomicrospira sp.]MBE0492955.1 ROK family protein [Thiomicrospira sp.]
MRLGIDLGGTKIEIVALDAHNEICLRERVMAPKGCYVDTLEAMVTLVHQAEHALGQTGSVGVGIPGAISAKTGRVKNANSTWLIGEDLRGDLQTRLGREVRIANDANCFALSEASQGAAQQAQSVFGVIVGTGCGGGLVVNGQILAGANAIAGEWGHNPLPWSTEQDVNVACYCGQQNCIETFLSGTGLAQRYAGYTGEQCTAQQIVGLMREGYSPAVQMMDRYYNWMAKGLASVINVFDPEVIVLGGGLSQVNELYAEVPKRWAQWVFSDQVVTELKPPMFGDSSGVMGAAWLWGQGEE